MGMQPKWQAPAINRTQVGDMLVTMLSDGYLDVSFELLSGINGSRAEALLQRRGAPVAPRININVYVVQTAQHTILIDSGAGGIKGWGGRLPVALAAAGIDPLQIDTILLTHAAASQLPCRRRCFEMCSSYLSTKKNWRSGAIKS
ncbi:MAG: MBL fold metallo-hydrolase [Pantoea sp.]|uniref:MBL fold metallo-hydrolase n=1 Tax=Pantoea sp. TaxID=69393 RepID=UPI0039E5187E